MSTYSQMLRGSAWMVVMRWTMRLVGLVSMMILARLLTPEDFGIVAMATLVYGLLTTTFALGTAQLLIRMQNADNSHYDTAWTITILQSIVLGAVVILAAPLVARYFDEPRVDSVIRLLALSAVLSGLTNVGIVNFRKELDFATDFRYQVYVRLSRFAITITLAWALRSYWALVLGVVGSAGMALVLSFWMHPMRPRVSLAHWRNFISYSLWVTPGNVLNQLFERAPAFIVGAVEATTKLGTYHVATELSRMVTTELVVPAQRGLYPVLAKLIDDKDALRDAFLNVLRTVAIVAFAVGPGLAVVADQFVLIVLGEQWAFAVPLIRWLSVAGAFHSLGFLLTYHVFLLTGQERALFFLFAGRLAVSVPVLIYAANHHGLQGVAIAVAFIYAAFVPVASFALKIAIPVTGWTALGCMARPALSAGAMVAAVHWGRSIGLDGPVAQLARDASIGAIAYISATVTLWFAAGRPSGPERAALDLTVRKWRERFPRTTG